MEKQGINKILVSIIGIAFFVSLSGSVSANSGLVAYYPFEGDFEDSSCNLFHGSNKGTTFTGGISGQGIYLDTDDVYVELPIDSRFNLVDSMTLSAWIYPMGPTGNDGNWGGGIIAKGHPDVEGFGLLYDMYHAKRLTLSVRNSDGSYIHLTSPPYGYNQWIFVAGTYDGQTIKLFVNGSLVASDIFSGQISQTVQPITIGTSALTFYGNRGFYGIIDEVLIYGVALSSSDIQTLYSGGIPHFNSSCEIEVPPPEVEERLTALEAIVEEIQDELAEKNRAIDELNATNQNQSIIIQEHETKIGLLESLINSIQDALYDFMELVNSYLFNLPKGLRANMVCGALEGSNETSATGFGLYCEINDKGACVCSQV